LRVGVVAQSCKSSVFGGERRTLNALLKVWWDENEEAADQIEEGPGDRQANDHDDGSFEPSRGLTDGFDWDGFPLKTGRAKEFSFMLSDAFPAEIAGTRRTAGDRFAIHMNQAPLKSELHREFSGKNGRENEPQIARITWIIGGKELTVGFRRL
jgi:hypothetical protein